MSTPSAATAANAKTGPPSVVVIGGTGLIGKRICQKLLENGYRVVIAGRNELTGRSHEPDIATTPEQRKRLRFIAFDASLEPHEGRDRPMFDALRTCKAIVQCAGEPLLGKGGRQSTESGVAAAIASRATVSVRVRGLLEQIQDLRKKKSKTGKSKTKRAYVLLSSASVYGHRTETLAAAVTEESKSFADVWSREWKRVEEEARKIEYLPLNFRFVSLRLPIVLDSAGGFFAGLQQLYALGLGGPMGDAKFSWFPWVHSRDVARLVRFAIENEGYAGPINAAASNPTHHQLAKEMANKMRCSRFWKWKSIPTLALRAWYGQSSLMITSTRQLNCDKLKSLGFVFEFDNLSSALDELLHINKDDLQTEVFVDEDGETHQVMRRPNSSSAVSSAVAFLMQPQVLLAIGATAIVGTVAWRMWKRNGGGSGSRGSGRSSSSYDSRANNYTSTPPEKRVYIGDIISDLLSDSGKKSSYR